MRSRRWRDQNSLRLSVSWRRAIGRWLTVCGRLAIGRSLSVGRWLPVWLIWRLSVGLWLRLTIGLSRLSVGLWLGLTILDLSVWSYGLAWYGLVATSWWNLLLNNIGSRVVRGGHNCDSAGIVLSVSVPSASDNQNNPEEAAED